ncbi:hypothetical protein M422DRAFT_26014 [Sphaerobolus stellatus SS14]|nr:hypothetical protein M422DRAFT_26014 [Sphaerobolus stellatus SS14]
MPSPTQNNNQFIMMQAFMDYLRLFSHGVSRQKRRFPPMEETQFQTFCYAAYIEVMQRGGGVPDHLVLNSDSYIHMAESSERLAWVPVNIFNGLVDTLCLELQRRLCMKMEPDSVQMESPLSPTDEVTYWDGYQNRRSSSPLLTDTVEILGYLDSIRHRLLSNNPLYYEVLNLLEDARNSDCYSTTFTTYERDLSSNAITQRVEKLLNDYPELLEPTLFPWETFPEELVEHGDLGWAHRYQKFSTSSKLCLDENLTDLSTGPVAFGGYASIWTGCCAGKKVAVKVARIFSPAHDSKSRILKRLWREFLIWNKLQHPNVLPCVGFSYIFDCGGDLGIPSLISPWMSNGTVLEYTKANPKANRMQLITGIAAGLGYLHSRKRPIIHGDISATNILVSDNGIPCIADFGLSRIFNIPRSYSSSTSSGPAGSLRWMAPELFFNRPATASSDVWAFGMTMLEIITGRSPYDDIALDPVVLREIVDGRIPRRPVAMSLTDGLWALCMECWSYGVSDRPSMKLIVKWLRNIEETEESFVANV